VRQKLEASKPNMLNFGASFINSMLDQPSIPCKANLLTRVADMDELQSENELAVYVPTPNPLARRHASVPNSMRSTATTNSTAQGHADAEE
jgi:spermidine-citrate ligase